MLGSGMGRQSTVIRPEDTAEQVDQGRFSSTVLAEKNVPLAAADPHGDILERHDAREALADPFQPQNVVICCV